MKVSEINAILAKVYNVVNVCEMLTMLRQTLINEGKKEQPTERYKELARLQKAKDLAERNYNDELEAILIQDSAFSQYLTMCSTYAANEIQRKFGYTSFAEWICEKKISPENLYTSLATLSAFMAKAIDEYKVLQGLAKEKRKKGNLLSERIAAMKAELAKAEAELKQAEAAQTE